MVAAVLNIEIDIKIVHAAALSIEVASRYGTLIALSLHRNYGEARGSVVVAAVLNIVIDIKNVHAAALSTEIASRLYFSYIELALGLWCKEVCGGGCCIEHRD